MRIPVSNHNFSKTHPVFWDFLQEIERQCKTDLQAETSLSLRWNDYCGNKLMFKNAFVLSKFRDKCGEKYKTGKGNTFYFMNGKLDFSRHNFLLHLCLKCTPSLQQLKSITVLIFLPLWMYAWRHTYKNMQKKNRKEEKIDHRKFCLCSVCNSFPHSIPLLILDFKVVFFF